MLWNITVILFGYTVLLCPQDMMIVCIWFEFPLVTSFFFFFFRCSVPLPLLYRWHWSKTFISLLLGEVRSLRRFYQAGINNVPPYLDRNYLSCFCPLYSRLRKCYNSVVSHDDTALFFLLWLLRGETSVNRERVKTNTKWTVRQPAN